MSDDDISIDEKRVYGDRFGAVDLAVATEMGVVRVAVSGEQVGEFGLATRGAARDVARVPPALGGGVAVATADDVLVGAIDDPEATGFGGAVAVGRHGDDLLAADEDGTIARWTGTRAPPAEVDGGKGRDEHRDKGGDEGSEHAAGEQAWETVGTVDGDVRAIDGDLVATSDGVYRLTGGTLQQAGLDDVHDVAAGVVPHAATSTGLYRLGNGWLDALDGDMRVVAITADRGRVGRGHAATESTFFEHVDGEWVERDVASPVTDVVHGPRDYAITGDGVFLLRRDDGWHARTLGVPGATGLAVVPDTA